MQEIPGSHLSQPEKRKKSIDKPKFRVSEQEEMLKEQKYRISTPEPEIEDQINRSMYITLVFGNLNKSDTEKTLEDKKSAFAREILRVIPEFDENAVHFHIEGTHRKHSSKASKSKLPVIIAKLATRSLSEKVKFHFISASREGQTEVIA